MPLVTRRTSSPRVPGDTHASPAPPAPQTSPPRTEENSLERPSTNVVDFSDSSAAPSSRPSGMKSASHRTQPFLDADTAPRDLPVGGNFFMVAPRATRPQQPRTGVTSTPRATSTSASSSAPRGSEGPTTNRSVSSSPGLPQDSSSATSSEGDNVSESHQASPHAQHMPASAAGTASVEGAAPPTPPSVRSTRSLQPGSQRGGTVTSSVNSRGMSPPMPNEDDDYFQPFTASMRSDGAVENPQSHSPSPRTRQLEASPVNSEAEEDTVGHEQSDEVVMRTSASSTSQGQVGDFVYDDDANDVDSHNSLSDEDLCYRDAPQDAEDDYDEEDTFNMRTTSTVDSVTNRYDGERDEPAATEDVPVVSHFIDLNHEDDEDDSQGGGDGDIGPHAHVVHAPEPEREDSADAYAGVDDHDTASTAFSSSAVASSSVATWSHTEQSNDVPEVAPRNLEDDDDQGDDEDEEDFREDVNPVQVKQAPSDAKDDSRSFSNVADVPCLPPSQPKVPCPAAPTQSAPPAPPARRHSWSDPKVAKLLPPPTDVYRRQSFGTAPEEVTVGSATTPSDSSGRETTTPPPASSRNAHTAPAAVPPVPRQTPRPAPGETAHVLPDSMPTPVALVAPGSLQPSHVSRRYPQYFFRPADDAALARWHAHDQPAANQCQDCADCPHDTHSTCPECGGVMHDHGEGAAGRLQDRGSNVPASRLYQPAASNDAVLPMWEPPQMQGIPYNDVGQDGQAPPDDVTRTNPWEGEKRPHRAPRRQRPSERTYNSTMEGILSWSTTPVSMSLAPAAGADGESGLFEDEPAPELDALTRGTYPAPLLNAAKPAPIPYASGHQMPQRPPPAEPVFVPTRAGEEDPAHPGRSSSGPRRYNPYGPHGELDDVEPYPEEAPVPTPRDSVSQPLTAISQRNGRTARPEDTGDWSPAPVAPRGHPHANGSQPGAPCAGPAPDVDRTLPFDAAPLGGNRFVPRPAANELPACVGPVDRSWRRYLDASVRQPRMTPRVESRASTASAGPSSGRPSQSGGPWLGCAPGAWDGRPRTPALHGDGWHSAVPRGRRSTSPYGLSSAVNTSYVVYRGHSPAAPTTVSVMVPMTTRAKSLESVTTLPVDPDEEVWRQMVRKMELEKTRVHTESALRRNGHFSW